MSDRPRVPRPYKMPRPPRFDKNHNPLTYAVTEGEDGELIYMHRFLYEAEHGKIPEGYDVRHVNGDTMLNIEENLELYKIPARRLKRK